MSHAPKLSPSGLVVTNAQEGRSSVAATPGLAQTVLRTGMALGTVVAATNCVFALNAGAGPLAAVQGLVLVAFGVAGIVRTDVVARLLQPTGRVLVLPVLFGAGGALDAGLYEHFGGVAGAIVCMTAFMCSARWVALCIAVCAAGYLASLTLHGSSLAWMAGDGRSVLAEHLINFVGNGAVGLLMVTLMQRFLASVPQHLASVRAGGPSLTAPLALAASARHVALLPAADARTLIAPLTPAERQVLALLAAGRVPKQAAQDLTIAVPTVRSRIASAKRKTGARTIDHLVAMYTEAELAV
ncbi:MAG: LuxR C-terminal-related transcriptional regulator [Chloroflexi bacterium]|nr:LuxR C-terminal-related transcriptional regulator [Chloroflexota bacterium]